jgi:hypothetical protein
VSFKLCPAVSVLCLLAFVLSILPLSYDTLCPNPLGLTPGVIYLDHNATTPIAPEVLEASCHPERSERSRFALTTEWGNPCSLGTRLLLTTYS